MNIISQMTRASSMPHECLSERRAVLGDSLLGEGVLGDSVLGDSVLGDSVYQLQWVWHNSRPLLLQLVDPLIPPCTS